MKQFFFSKMSGAGNDFILFDSKINPELKFSSEQIKKLCDRQNCIGADGILLISDSDGHDFELKYFNADGSTGALCANGTRCGIKYAYSTGKFSGTKTTFVSNGIIYSGEMIGEDKVKLYFNSPSTIKRNFKIKAAGQLINAGYVDPGGPHVVIEVKDVLLDSKNPKRFFESLDDFPVYNLGKEIRYHKDFAPHGTNVNFIEVHNSEIYIRTYERGVENETLACGTGSVAAAIITQDKYNLTLPVSLTTRSGEKLEVNFNDNNGIIEDLTLIGPAIVTFKGEITI
jgi:diaminopimelate epimerase